eukprot:96869-Chlamydomonas_euryale.AAC.1
MPVRKSERRCSRRSHEVRGERLAVFGVKRPARRDGAQQFGRFSSAAACGAGEAPVAFLSPCRHGSAHQSGGEEGARPQLQAHACGGPACGRPSSHSIPRIARAWRVPMRAHGDPGAPDQS